MKYIAILLIMAFSTINADEIQRIESIVKDISKLRSDYVKCQDELDLCSLKLKDETQKNIILQDELKLYSNFSKKEKEFRNEIDSLKKRLKEATKALKTKEIENKNLLLSMNENNISSENSNNCFKIQTNEDENKFPDLEMKEKYKQEKQKNVKMQTAQKKDAKIIVFTPSAFRLNKDADIYDAIDGNKIGKWEKRTSFTSNQKTDSWVKVTGYFIDKVWGPSKKEIWVKASDVMQRDK
ncbi:hypothetical protein GJV85_06085 [Sulfurimonas aquatica]|uniref:SH3 domain-containing protein n=1 Tax=Sulfurimonas aquatica TaxID=2672570 RepID=A0A975GCG4_9BACT|nr:hypothetical protein [Sulfurimonas aquatica]QSZ41691.1 hypothetical protein GJV85_06085 [Sulfurimonas aquatica]